MLEWEIRYLHYKSFRNCMAKANNRENEIPKDEQYGTLKHIRDLFREFRGKKFWPLFESEGHDNTVFEKCKCRNEKK